MKTLSIDIETYSSENLAKCGVYRYAEAPDFEVLLSGYSADGGPVEVVDLAAGEMLPADIRSALTDPAVTKWAFNAQFGRVCLSRFWLSDRTVSRPILLALHDGLGGNTGSAAFLGRRRRCAWLGKAEAEGRKRPHPLFLHPGKGKGRQQVSALSIGRPGKVGAFQGI